MNLASLRPTGSVHARTSAGVDDGAGATFDAGVVTVRPVRAAFGPHLTLVSVDNHGRLWMRFSTAVLVMVAGLALMTVPLVGLYVAGHGLVESGQISLRDTTFRAPTPIDPGKVTPSVTGPTELPLASHHHSR